MNKEELLKFWENRWSWYLTYAEVAFYERNKRKYKHFLALSEQVRNCINELKESSI